MAIHGLATAAALVVGAAVSFFIPQAANPVSPHDVTRWGVVYEVPAMKQVVEKRDVRYAGNGADSLEFDLCYPEAPRAGKRWPAVVFVNGVGDEPQAAPGGSRQFKDWEIYRSWARLVAAHGLVGINMESRAGACDANLRDLFAHLKKEAGALSIDAERLALFCCSANVGVGLPFAMSGEAQGLRAAVVFYGSTEVTTLRRDVRVLFVVAGRDGPGMLAAANDYQQRSTAQGAPWTIRVEPELPHAFDALDPGVQSRRVVQQAVQFFASELDDPPMPASGNPPARQGLAAIYGQQPELAVPIYREFVAKDKTDQEAQAALGRSLLFTGHPAEAIAPLQAALALGGDDPGVRNALGQALQATGDHRGAVPHLARAAEHMESQGWADAQLYGALGYSQLMTGDATGGVSSYEKAFAAGIPEGATTRGLAAYNLACGYARLKRRDEAFARLEEALANGGLDARRLTGDRDLESLRGDPRYVGLLERVRARRSISANGVVDPPGEPDERIRALIDRADEALAQELVDAQGLLTDPAYLPAHEYPEFRELIEANAPTGEIALVTGIEPGVRLVVRGLVQDAQGRAVPGALVYAYQTSARGYYAGNDAQIGGDGGATRHARLFAYVKTDAQGRFTLRTVRPGGYPNTNIPAHVHVHVDAPVPTSATSAARERAATARGEVQFADDPRLTEVQRAAARQEGSSVAQVHHENEGVQRVDVTFVLR